MSFRSFLLASVVFAARMAQGEDQLRVVLIEVASKEAVAIRTELGDAAKGAKPEAIDAVLKRKGISVLGDFKETNPWRQQPVEMSKRTGVLKVDGEELKDLGVMATIEGSRFEGVVTDMLQAEIVTEAGSKAYRSRHMVGNILRPKSGQWQERASWGDGKRTLMLWQHV